MLNKKKFICSLDDLKKKKYIVLWIEEWKDELIVFINKDSEIKIMSSICPHFGGEIYYNTKKENLRCKWHAWEFSPDTGRCLTHNIKGVLSKYNFAVEPNNLKSYKYKISDSKIYALNE